MRADAVSARCSLELLFDRSSDPGADRAIVGLGTALDFGQGLLGEANGDHLGHRGFRRRQAPCGVWFSALA